MSNQCVVHCPLCMEEMDPTDQQLKPCKCGYEICVWCWNHIIQMADKDNAEGRCPACRVPYNKERILRMTISTERLAKQDSQKQKFQKTKSKASDLPKDLNTVRVIRRNLVYVAGVPVTLADEMTLRKKEFFGQYGKIVRVVVVPAAEAFLKSRVVYITFTKVEEALRCIEVVDGFILDGSHLKACFGTTRYCHAWLKNSRCNNPNCLYVHDVCPQEDICTKEEVVSACTSKVQKSSGYVSNNLLRCSGYILPPPMDTSFCSISSNTGGTLVQSLAHKPFDDGKKHLEKGDGRKRSSLPPTASWASTHTSGRLSYASAAVSLGPVDYPCIPSNLIMKATDAGSQVLVPFQNVNQSDEQVVTRRNSMAVTNRLVKNTTSTERHTDAELRENTGLPSLMAYDQANIAIESSTAHGSSFDNCNNDQVQKLIASPNASNLDRSNSNLQLSVASANNFIRCPTMDKTKLDSSDVFCSAIHRSNQGSAFVDRVTVSLSSANEYITSSKQDTSISNLQAISHGPLLKDFSATQVHAPYHDRLSGCSDVIPVKCNKHEIFSSSVSIDNRDSISTSSTGSSKIQGCRGFGSSTCSAVGSNSILHKQGKLENKSSSFANEDFELQTLEYPSHKLPLLEKGIISRNSGDSQEDSRILDEADKSRKEYDGTSDILSLDLGWVDHLIGPLNFARSYADNDRSDCSNIFDCKTSCNGKNFVHVSARMYNLDHASAKSFFSESNVFNVENWGRLGNVEKSATHIDTCHINSGIPLLDLNEDSSVNWQHSLFAADVTNQSRSLFSSCQSASTLKLGSQLSAYSSQSISVPPGFYPQAADDLESPILKLSRSGSDFRSYLHGCGHRNCSQGINTCNSYEYLEINDTASTAFCGGKLSQSSQPISPNCSPSTVEFAKRNLMFPNFRNLSENLVELANENVATTTDNMNWQNETDIYNVPWGSCGIMGSFTGRGSEVTKRNLSEILNSLVPGSKYGSLR